jgi:hypothetical protein
MPRGVSLVRDEDHAVVGHGQGEGLSDNVAQLDVANEETVTAEDLYALAAGVEDVDVAVGAEGHVDGARQLAGTAALLTDRSQRLAAGTEDVDFPAVGVQHVGFVRRGYLDGDRLVQLRLTVAPPVHARCFEDVHQATAVGDVDGAVRAQRQRAGSIRRPGPALSGQLERSVGFVTRLRDGLSETLNGRYADQQRGGCPPLGSPGKVIPLQLHGGAGSKLRSTSGRSAS